ncbi:DUF4158 domain-containing protein [Streptomyces sp. HD1123-B1]
MATQDVFSAEELARLRGFPEIDRAELIRYFTLTGADEAFVRQFRTGRNASTSKIAALHEGGQLQGCEQVPQTGGNAFHASLHPTFVVRLSR